MKRPWALSVVAFLLQACQPVAPDPEGVLAISKRGDTLALSATLNSRFDALELSADLRVTSLPFPGDVAPMGDGRFAVLDRMDANVSIFDSSGVILGSFGGKGEGPGELAEPYAVARYQGGLAVWDQRGRLTTFRDDGSLNGVNTEEARGDGPAVWLRWPLTNWEKPFQLSREDVTRRLGPLPDGTVGLLLQADDERLDDRLGPRDASADFPYALLSFDGVAQLVDTVRHLRGLSLSQAAPASSTRWAMGRERPYQARPMWASGRGWLAWGHGAESRVTLVSGTDTTLVVWPEDVRPLGEADWTAYHRWRFEAARRLESQGKIAEWANLVVPWKKLRAETSEWQGGTDRPQIAGMVGFGSCLGLLGFRPDDGPHAESRWLILINVRHPSASLVVRPEAEPGFVRAVDAHAVYYLSIGEDGARAVERFPFPEGVSCQ